MRGGARSDGPKPTEMSNVSLYVFSSNKKLNFILDLDETLISAEATEEYDFEKYKKFTLKKL